MTPTTRFEVHGWHKSTEEDSYADGCLPHTGHDFSGDDSWHAETIDALVEKLRAFVPFTSEGDAVQRDSCDEVGRVDISGMETNDGDEPTPAQLEAWKAGEVRLWYCTYTFYVERVTRERVSTITPATPEAQKP